MRFLPCNFLAGLRPRLRRRVALIACLLAALTAPAGAVMHLKQGMDAPPIKLKDVSGGEIGTAELRGRVVVVIFGEIYHEKTRDACAQVQAMIQDPRLVEQKIVPLLITSQEGKAEDYKLEAARQVSVTVLRDVQRQVFGVYQVAVMPSVVVIDKEGRVVVAVAGMIPRFSDILNDALLYAAGKLSDEQYRRTLNVTTQPAATGPTDAALRSERLASLGRQLARRGLDELAAEKFAEAIQLDPRHTAVQLDLGMLQLRHKRLAEAEKQFRLVLAEQPNSTQARLGLAFVQATRGGAELDQAETTVRELLSKQPAQPRAHYLLGMILEQRGKPAEAAASYKKAAELLLEGGQEEPAP